MSVNLVVSRVCQSGTGLGTWLLVWPGSLGKKPGPRGFCRRGHSVLCAALPVPLSGRCPRMVPRELRPESWCRRRHREKTRALRLKRRGA